MSKKSKLFNNNDIERRNTTAKQSAPTTSTNTNQPSSVGLRLCYGVI